MLSQCRFCATPLTESVADLGLSPVSNHFRDSATAQSTGQTFYPLHAMVCTNCWLVQLTEVETPAHFDDNYVYFSSYSSSWLEHSKAYAEQMIARLGLHMQSKVVEIASNDGYLLQYFKNADIPVLGIEPSGNVAEEARSKHGIETIVEFFGRECAEKQVTNGNMADLIAANNVMAHVPDINDFISGFKILLREGGTITVEFPHLLKMMEDCQFDTIYHEHFSYLSLHSVETIFAAHGLKLYGVQELSTHGGSLRIFAGHQDSCPQNAELFQTLEKVRADEKTAGLQTIAPYAAFGKAVEQRKTEFLTFLIEAKNAGRSVVGYGAPAKGNTMLNYCGVGPELLAYTVDMNPHKQSQYLPGLNIPVHAPEKIMQDQPDYVVILPWNLREEISSQLKDIRDWGGQFVTAIPRLEIF